MTEISLILVAILLLFMNAFFVAAEFGLVRLRNTRIADIKKTHSMRGQILEYVHTHLDAYLSACQLGITLASLGLGWIGEPVFSQLFEPIFRMLQIKSTEVIEVVSFLTAFTLLSFLHIVVGELMPKSLAIRQSEMVSIWTAVPLYAFYWLMYPVIWLLNSCSNFLLHIAGLGDVNKKENFYSTGEIKLILHASHVHGELTRDEARILEHTLEFVDLNVTEVMRPREEMIMLNLDQPINEMLDLVMQSRYSRYPVYDNTKNEVVGVIHVKDLFSALYQQKSIQSIEDLIRPIIKVESHQSAIVLLRKFREGMPHFALVYRAATIAGFVTLDNLLHVMIGRIKDEFHRTKDDWIANEDGTFLISGTCSISSLERALKIDIETDDETEDEDEKMQIVSELILNKLGRLPEEGECVEFKEFKVIIKKMHGNRIAELKIYPILNIKNANEKE